MTAEVTTEGNAWKRSLDELRAERPSRRVLVGAVLGLLGLQAAGVAAQDSQFCKPCKKHGTCNGDTDYCLDGYCVASDAICNGFFYDVSCETVQKKKSRRLFSCKPDVGGQCCNRRGRHCKDAQRLCF